MKIALSNGGEALVDATDYKKLSVFTWRRRDAPHTSYAYTVQRLPNIAKHQKGKLVYILMHRLILGLTERLHYADHINHNGLDNRRKNIRKVTPRENVLNRRKIIKNPNP